MCNSNLRPVKSFEHLDELIAKGVKVYFDESELLSCHKKPLDITSGYLYLAWVAEGYVALTLQHLRYLKYAPKKIRRPFKDGDKLEDVVEVCCLVENGFKIVNIIDCGYNDTVCVTVVSITGRIILQLNSKLDLTVEVEE